MSPHPYAFLALFAAVAFAFPVILLSVARLWTRFFQPQKPSATKNDAYECGVASTGDTWIQFKVQYYIYALVFVVFDIEAVFLFPIAAAFGQLDLFAVGAAALFIFLLADGLIYAWSRGVLEWV